MNLKTGIIISIIISALLLLTSCTIVKEGNGNGSGNNTTQYTLTVSVGTGVTGSPVSGTFKYNEGTTVNYNYSLTDSSYSNLQVTLNGTHVAASGSIVMNGNYTLNASADITTASYDIRALWIGTATDSNGDPDPFQITFSGDLLSGTTTGYVDDPTKIVTGTYSVSGTTTTFSLWYGSVRNFQFTGTFNGANNISGDWVWTDANGKKWYGTFTIDRQ